MARRFNEPGRFVTFPGYEWTSQVPPGQNLHRVVIYRDGADRARQTVPATTYAPQGSTDPEYLWKLLQMYEDKTGGDVLAIAHNGNLSNGLMFSVETNDGKPYTKELAELRARMVIRLEGSLHRVITADYRGGQGKMGGVMHARLLDLRSGATRDRGFRADQTVAGDAPVSAVIELLTRHEHVFVDALGGIGGVVTRADIQKPVVRMWLFGMITLIEMTVVERVAALFPEEAWRDRLSPARLARAEALHDLTAPLDWCEAALTVRHARGAEGDKAEDMQKVAQHLRRKRLKDMGVEFDKGDAE